MKEDHHPHLSPSRFPALAHCIHYESLPLDSVSRRRGTLIHQYAAKFLRNNPIGSVPMEEVEAAGLGEWCARETHKVMTELRGVEYRVNIMNYMVVPPEVVTFGTCDAWGYDGVQLVLVDVKSGKERDYREQMAVYALGLMEEQRELSCKCVVLYCDGQTQTTYTFTLDEAELIVFDVVNRVNLGVEPPQENEHCKWCARKPTCPVWTVPAAQALAIAEKKFDLEGLKQDPIRLGEFLEKWRKAEKLVEDAKLKDAAKEFLTTDPRSIPGWTVQTVNGRLSYDDEEIEEIINLIPEMGMDRARCFIDVDRKAFELAWESHSKGKPVPVIPTQHAGTYTKLVRAKK